MLSRRARQPAREGIRIEAGRGHQRDDVAVVRIDGHHRATPFDQSLLGDELCR
jgi:hypothetical protein